ncbi:MAG: gamma-glutamyl-gamma-aminobutyrate hydrolase family protein [Lachnospiraceae bacterium]|nr:gamma-glutamyl-gamma-aminobutyrate hydrolase family protein [Robinsoniella sp.]MDY3766557.1 gamma-glutamyl-gamma-aminobutyrate hydrolase family protein [Lachnospiraceae bacterium]
MKKPVIGIAGNILIVEGGKTPGMYRSYVNHDYVVSIRNAGGIPVILPICHDERDVEEVLEHLDGILMSGGYDMDPELYGEEALTEQGFIMREVDDSDLLLIRKAYEKKKPIFGICKGVQSINVAFGGNLYQDLKVQRPGCIRHNQKGPGADAAHMVTIHPESFLQSCFGDHVRVNTHHHQAVKAVAEGFFVAAQAKDGVVEAIEKKEGSFVLGVQWHPEMMASAGDRQMQRMFERFIEKCME